MKYATLSANEFAVLGVLWDSDTALSRPEILTKLDGRNWNPNSIHLVLNNLIKKGFIVIDGITRCGQSYGRTYSPLKTKSEYAAELALGALADSPDEESVVSVMAAMVKKTKISPEAVADLKQMLDDWQKEQKNG